MAEVWLARQEMAGVQRLVALKRMHSELAEDEGFVKMFLDELRLAPQLGHPNIGHVFEVGEIDGRYFLAMEYIMGRDLASVLTRIEARDEALPLEILFEIGRAVASALDHAHTRTSSDGRPRGIVHRDVSPDNVILTFDGSVKLVDFGIAMAEGRLAHTKVGAMKGKPPYMAPEQVLGEPVDARTDLFALATLLYRAGVGTHPFAGSSPERVFHKVVELVPRSAHRLSPDLPEAFGELLARTMEKDPDERPPNADAFHTQLEAIATGEGLMISPKGLARWMLECFPEAADAQATLNADPLDGGAHHTTSYFASSLVPEASSAPPETVTSRVVLPEAQAEADLEPATTIARVETPTDPRARSPEAADDDPEMATSVTARVPGAAPASPPPDEEGNETHFERIPSHRPRGEVPERADRRASPLRPAEPSRATKAPRAAQRASSAPLPSARARSSGPWRIEDHWDHLPAPYRSPAAVGTVAFVLAALLFLAAVGLRTLLG